MSCAVSRSSANSLVAMRCSFGEARSFASDRAAAGSRIVRAFRAAVDWLARNRLWHEGRTVDPRLLDDFAVSNPEAARELRKLLGL
jgi:hypothetical protein